MTGVPPSDPACPNTAASAAEKRRQVVLITGLSGAGMSVALKALEDLGFEAVDNLRLSLVPALLQLDESSRKPLAVVVDSRTRGFTAEALLAQLHQLEQRPELAVRLLFLDCTDEVLQRRFTETRRRHPLASDRPVPDGIRRERALLHLLADRADVTIDTTELSIHDLRRQLGGHFQIAAGSALQVFVTSFSFRRGLPREADLVFDVRFLANPHYHVELRPLSGLDQPVAQMVTADPDYAEFFGHLTGLLGTLLPRYHQEGKSYLTIAVGCTGGRHRSVLVAERLAGWLRDRDVPVNLQHRDLERATPRPG